MIKPVIKHYYPENSFAQEYEDILCKSLFEEFEISKDQDFRTVVDIGASDGITLSNSRLFVELGFRSLLVDADPNRYFNLKKNSSSFNNCYVSNEYVSSDNVSTLLTSAAISNLGILTINIDGFDLLILRSLLPFNPKIVVIEYNPTIPLHISFEQEVGQNNLGNSALAIFEFMSSVGYHLRFATQTNLIFSQKPSHQELQLRHLLDDEQTVRGIWVGYDGSINFEGRPFLEFPWHGLDQRIRISGVPLAFRQFFGGGNKSNLKAKSWQILRRLVNLRDRVVSRIDQI